MKIMVNRLILLLILGVIKNVCSLEMNKQVIYEAQWGNGAYEIGKDNYCDMPDESWCIPSSFYFNGKILSIYDINNFRIQIIEPHTKSVTTISFNITMSIDRIENVTIDGRIIVKKSNREIYYYNNTKWYRISSLNGFHFMVEYLNTKIIKDKYKIKFFDSKYIELNKDSLPKDIKILSDGTIYLKKKQSILIDDIKNLRRYVRQYYHEIIAPDSVDSIPALFEFPDTSITKPYFRYPFGSGFAPWFLQFDEDFNSYWYTNTDVYVDSTINKDEKVKAIFIFDKKGKLLNWFAEPRPTEGWKNGARLVVNEEGRIFRMHYHDTEGIRIVEYLYKETE